MPGVRGEVGALVEGTPVHTCMYVCMYLISKDGDIIMTSC